MEEEKKRIKKKREEKCWGQKGKGNYRGLVGLQFYLAVMRLSSGWSRQKSDVLCPQIMIYPGQHVSLQNLFFSSLHCVFHFQESRKEAKTNKETKKHRKQ
jgi:hypothetical protein